MTRLHRLDLTGQKYGRWTVLSHAGANQRGEVLWNCQCDCGSERAVKAGSLRSGRSTSCGCYHKEAVTVHGMYRTPEHTSWKAMIDRCQCPTNVGYPLYGGRGIKVCSRWENDFAAFLSDMGPRPEGTTLDRIDSNGDYEPGNCRWADATTQIRNRSNTRRLAINGVTKPIAQWADENGLTAKLISERLGLGWSPESAALTPVMTQFRRQRRAFCNPSSDPKEG